MGTVFDQEEIVSVAQRAKSLHVTWKAKVVDCQDGPDIAADLRLELCPIRRTIPPNRIEFNLRAKVFDWFDCRRTKISGNQNSLPRPDPQRTHSMKNSVAGPKEIEARRA